MNKERSSITIGLIFSIYAATVAGIISFYLAGGIPVLAKDVGMSGAWGLLVFFNLIYATLSVLAFIGLIQLSKKFKVVIPSYIPTVISASFVSVAINLYGIKSDGQGHNFIFFCLIIVGFSLVSFVITTSIYNALTRNSARAKKKTVE